MYTPSRLRRVSPRAEAKAAASKPPSPVRKEARRSRRNLFGVLALGPGAFSLILLTLSYTYLPQLLDTLLGPAAMAKVERQVALGGPFAFLIPAAVLFRVAIFSPAVAEAVGIKKPRDAAVPLELSRQQRATKARDELYLERMRAKRRGEDV